MGVYENIDVDDLFDQAQRTTQVSQGLARVADSIAKRAESIDSTEGGGSAEITVTDGYAPGTGRRYFQVNSSDATGEYGGPGRSRLSTLRRASGGATSGY